jgi:nitrite reductase/ring-hydroxylating ferredoxin subunit
VSSFKVASETAIAPGQLLGVEAGGRRICLARIDDGQVFAISDICTHEEAFLSEGEIWDGAVQCPQHGSLFDLATGQVTGLPAQIPVETFPVRIEGGEIFVDTGE